MIKVKSQAYRKTILLLFLVFFSLATSCNDETPQFKSYKQSILTFKSGEKVTVYIAENQQQQTLGLSGVKPEQLKDNEAMLFPQEEMSNRMFWMPDTHMNLDIFFLNEDFYVLDIHRNLQHFPKRSPESEIPRSKTVYSQHVLELKATSPLSAKIKRGMILDIKPKN